MTMAPTRDEFRLLKRPDHLVCSQGAGRGGRGGALAFTIALHVVVVLALIAGLHAAHTLPVQEIVARIEMVKKKAEVLPPPPPQLLHPPEAVIAVPPPVVIQTIPPPHMEAPPAVIALSTPLQATIVGEGRDAFLGRLLSQLNRFKRYPPEARRAHIEGMVMLHFIMDAGGNLLSVEIAKSSGRPVLDAEALALIRRAEPLPALPAGFPAKTLDAVVPVEFSLRE